MEVGYGNMQIMRPVHMKLKLNAQVMLVMTKLPWHQMLTMSITLGLLKVMMVMTLRIKLDQWWTSPNLLLGNTMSLSIAN